MASEMLLANKYLNIVNQWCQSWLRQLESRMRLKAHVRFGGGRLKTQVMLGVGRLPDPSCTTCYSGLFTSSSSSPIKLGNSSMRLLPAIQLMPAWTAQQLREATAWGKHPKYLIRDNDKKYGKQFSAVARTSGTKEIKTPFEAPRANAICERFIGSMRRECLNHFLILHQHQLSRLVSRYVDFYDQQRPHQGIDQQIPVRFGNTRQPLSNTAKGKVVSTPVLQGLHHSYTYGH